MNLPDKFKDLDVVDEKQFCFDVLSRCRFVEGFYEQLKVLVESTPSPFTEDSMVRELKPEFKNCNC